MRGDDLHGHPATGHIQVDRPAGLICRYTEIYQPNLSSLAAGEDRVAVMAFALQQGGPGDDLILGLLSQPMSEFQAVPIRSIDFLHRDHVPVQFTNDIADAGWIVPTVAPDASMDIIGSERQLHVSPSALWSVIPPAGWTATFPTPRRSARFRRRSRRGAEYYRVRDAGWFQSPGPETARDPEAPGAPPTPYRGKSLSPGCAKHQPRH